MSVATVATMTRVRCSRMVQRYSASPGSLSENSIGGGTSAWRDRLATSSPGSSTRRAGSCFGPICSMPLEQDKDPRPWLESRYHIETPATTYDAGGQERVTALDEARRKPRSFDRNSALRRR